MQRHLYSRIIFTVILNIGAAVFGQPRGTDIYLFNYTCEKDRFVLENMSNITNRPGYDNQPFFIPTAESVLFSSIRGDGQADIYRYDIETGATTRLTEIKSQTNSNRGRWSFMETASN